MTKILEFQGPWRFLSNFWPCELHYSGTTWPSAEHAYQAAKTRLPHQKELIRAAPSPAVAKRLGRRIPHSAMHADWEHIKLTVMSNIVHAKFEDPELRKALLETGDAILEEGNWWGDTFWGVSPAGSGVGRNYLGHILMQVREELRSGL